MALSSGGRARAETMKPIVRLHHLDGKRRISRIAPGKIESQRKGYFIPLYRSSFRKSIVDNNPTEAAARIIRIRQSNKFLIVLSSYRS
jgi:hypothetical protein